MDSNNHALNILARLFKYATILMVTLKLMKVINWSWWWVLAPVWLAIVMLAVALMIYTKKK